MLTAKADGSATSSVSATSKSTATPTIVRESNAADAAQRGSFSSLRGRQLHFIRLQMSSGLRARPAAGGAVVNEDTELYYSSDAPDAVHRRQQQQQHAPAAAAAAAENDSSSEGEEVGCARRSAGAVRHAANQLRSNTPTASLLLAYARQNLREVRLLCGLSVLS